MNIIERKMDEGLVEYANKLSGLYSGAFRPKDKKRGGQYFTPKQISTFMAQLFDINKDKIALLDPGAGTGILSAAFCEKLLNRGRPVSLIIEAFENDIEIIPFLRQVLMECKKDLEQNGSKVEFNISAKDFILANEAYLSSPGLFTRMDEKRYDFIISNPPYFKVGTDSSCSRMMADLICGQPNIYVFFMTMAARMLADEGEMIFITPRSFCSGLYYKNFRKWFLRQIRITRIHIFESRKDIFDEDGVLQENIIIKAIKNSKEGKVIITTSKSKDVEMLKKIEVSYSDLISSRNNECFIRIPSNELDLDILRIIDTWPCTLNNLGMEISTGPVVDFRAKEYLRQDFIKGTAPLLWMHNMRNMKVIWPNKKNRKSAAIDIVEQTYPLLLPVKNYVLLKRFTSKEQKRRLDSAVLKKSEFPYEFVGIENHVNYIHKPNGSLSVNEAFGVAALLNTYLIDNYFRSFNGHTQVNATEIRNLPLPDLPTIKKIGEIISDSKDQPNNLDEKIALQLGIDSAIIMQLEEKYNGKN